MKRCMDITCYTDYPFLALGDQPDVKAPIRRVTVIHFDGNKRATVRAECGAIEWIKACYLYRNRARLSNGAVPITRRKLERMVSTRPQEEFEGVVVNASAGAMVVKLKPLHDECWPESTTTIDLSEVAAADLPKVKEGAAFTLEIYRRTAIRPASQRPARRVLAFVDNEAAAKVCVLDPTMG